MLDRRKKEIVFTWHAHVHYGDLCVLSKWQFIMNNRQMVEIWCIELFLQVFPGTRETRSPRIHTDESVDKPKIKLRNKNRCAPLIGTEMNPLRWLLCKRIICKSWKRSRNRKKKRNWTNTKIVNLWMWQGKRVKRGNNSHPVERKKKTKNWKRKQQQQQK